MRRAVLALVLSSCTIVRTLAMPEPLPVVDGPQHPHRWSPGTTTVRFTGYPFQAVKWGPGRRQLTERASKTLAASPTSVPDKAEYLVDTTVIVQEDSAPNGWSVLGI